MNITVLAPTTEDCGVADHVRHIFGNAKGIKIKKACFKNFLLSPLNPDMDVLHVEHEFFMYDRFVGVTGLAWQLWFWFCSRIVMYKLVTTIHSTYNVSKLRETFPQFAAWRWAFLPGKIYLWLYYWVILTSSHASIALTKVGQQNMKAIKPRARVELMPVRGYERVIFPADHGIIQRHAQFFVCFGFAFPNKGYDLAIRAVTILYRLGCKDVRLYIVSGNLPSAGIPGSGSTSYLDSLKQLAFDLQAPVVFTGFLKNEDPYLQELFLRAQAVVFPYRNRDFACSGAVNTAIASGCSVILSSAPCFDHYQTLPKFNEGEAGDLARLMQDMLDDVSRAKVANEVQRLWHSERMKPMISEHGALYASLIYGLSS